MLSLGERLKAGPIDPDEALTVVRRAVVSPHLFKVLIQALGPALQRARRFTRRELYLQGEFNLHDDAHHVKLSMTIVKPRRKGSTTILAHLQFKLHLDDGGYVKHIDLIPPPSVLLP